MMAWLRRLSPRAEKSTSAWSQSARVAAVLGILAVALDNEALGYVSVGIVLAGVLAGPVVARRCSHRTARRGAGRANLAADDADVRPRRSTACSPSGS